MLSPSNLLKSICYKMILKSRKRTMKTHFYLFSSIVLLTAFFGFKKANSYEFDKGFIATFGNSRDGQIINGLRTNMDVHSYKTNLAYTGTDELGAYWYGAGIGITETLCYLTANRYIYNKFAKETMREFRNNYKGTENFRSKNFEEGIKLAIDSYPDCRLK